MSLQLAWANHPSKPTQERPLSLSTNHQEVCSFKTFVVWLVGNGHKDPFVGLKRPKLPRHLIDILGDDEIKILFNIYNANTHFGARWQAMLAFVLDTGVRLEELITLKNEILDLEGYRVTVKVRGKGDKERYVKFGSKTHKLLSRYLQLYRPLKAAYVFASLEGQPLTSAGMQTMVRYIRDNSGIARFHLHLLRHAFDRSSGWPVARRLSPEMCAAVMESLITRGLGGGRLGCHIAFIRKLDAVLRHLVRRTVDAPLPLATKEQGGS